ncbi:MAG: hypothetical protein PHD81_02100 [Candidatus Nanoarchaeia archaeon]|nr:hypothetical protein [Candidatus Nanoarchaeia archaeon]MDD5587882.1 hypothetical protein [Candidatus Nanoarchaeia archaeon]
MQTHYKKYGINAIAEGEVVKFLKIARSLEEHFNEDSNFVKKQLKFFETYTINQFSRVYGNMIYLDNYIRKLNTTSKLYQSKKAQLENLHTEFMGLLMISKIHSPKEEIPEEMKQIIDDYMKRDWILKAKVN